MDSSDENAGRRGRRPTHRVWHVEGTGDDARWTEVCALWPTKTGHGLTGGVDAFLPAPGFTLTEKTSTRISCAYSAHSDKHQSLVVYIAAAAR
jgi:hypothetical protein